MSPYLYLLCGEIFANLVRNNQEIKGIPIGDREAKISQYADDTNLFSMYDKHSLDGIIHIFRIIEKQKINGTCNIEKCIAISMGKIEKHNDKWKRFIQL